MSPPMYPEPSAVRLAVEPLRAFKAFSAAVFAAGALPAQIRQWIAAHAVQCSYGIKGHTAEAPGQAVMQQHAHLGEGG